MSLFVAIQGSVKPASAANSSAVVIGAGTVEVNGTYTPRGTANDKPYYNLEGQPDNPDAYSIVYAAGGGLYWHIYNDNGDACYATDDDTALPWDGNWVIDVSGSNPAPLVYESGTVPNVLVAGAGSATSNGTYVFDETSFGLGESGAWRSGSNYIYIPLTATTWWLYDFALDVNAYIEQNAPNASPWGSTWGVNDGDPPEPTVTEV